MESKHLFCIVLLSLSLFSVYLSPSSCSSLTKTRQDQFPPPASELMYTITAPTTIYHPGEPVTFQFKIINPTSRPITLTFGGGYFTDFEIIGHPFGIYKHSEHYGGAYHCAIWERVLQGGEIWTLNGRLDPDDLYLLPGVYLIHAWLVRHGHAYLWIIVENPLLLTVPLLIGGSMVLMIVFNHRKKKVIFS
ncbi:MAG: BsuPI-related putative proteinase inhibitor [Promethearchaeota archaeon]